MSGSLRIIGEVERPLFLDFAALAALARAMPAASARLAGREILALPLDALLARVGVSATARTIVAESEDGARVMTLPLSALHGAQVLYRVGGGPLPRGLGGPLRLMVPGHGEVKALASLYVSDAAGARDDDTERVSFHGI
jgi:DMSO/TMAO reductase YedYZ molybdopterin-dependent catalytic subunit